MCSVRDCLISGKVFHKKCCFKIYNNYYCNIHKIAIEKIIEDVTIIANYSIKLFKNCGIKLRWYDKSIISKYMFLVDFERLPAIINFATTEVSTVNVCIIDYSNIDSHISILIDRRSPLKDSKCIDEFNISLLNYDDGLEKLKKGLKVLYKKAKKNSWKDVMKFIGNV